MLNLVDPAMTGIGGDAFCLFYEARTGRVRALNGSGRSAAGATVDAVCADLGIADRVYGAIPNTSVHAVTVPGAAAAWLDVVEKFGSGGVTAEQVLAPAVKMAEEGFPVSEISSYHVSGAPFTSVGRRRSRLISARVGQIRRRAQGKAQRDRPAQGGPGCTGRLQSAPAGRCPEEPAPGEDIQASW